MLDPFQDLVKFPETPGRTIRKYARGWLQATERRMEGYALRCKKWIAHSRRRKRQ